MGSSSSKPQKTSVIDMAGMRVRIKGRNPLDKKQIGHGTVLSTTMDCIVYDDDVDGDKRNSEVPPALVTWLVKYFKGWTFKQELNKYFMARSKLEGQPNVEFENVARIPDETLQNIDWHVPNAAKKVSVTSKTKSKVRIHVEFDVVIKSVDRDMSHSLYDVVALLASKMAWAFSKGSIPAEKAVYEVKKQWSDFTTSVDMLSFEVAKKNNDTTNRDEMLI
jgi:hypothetical protein